MKVEGRNAISEASSHHQEVTEVNCGARDVNIFSQEKLVPLKLEDPDF